MKCSHPCKRSGWQSVHCTRVENEETETEEKSQFHHRQIHMADSDMQRALTPIRQLKEPISGGLTTPMRVHNCEWLGTQPPELIFTPVMCTGTSDAWTITKIFGQSSSMSRVMADYCFLQTSTPNLVGMYRYWGREAEGNEPKPPEQFAPPASFLLTFQCPHVPFLEVTSSLSLAFKGL